VRKAVIIIVVVCLVVVVVVKIIITIIIMAVINVNGGMYNPVFRDAQHLCTEPSHRHRCASLAFIDRVCAGRAQEEVHEDLHGFDVRSDGRVRQWDHHDDGDDGGSFAGAGGACMVVVVLLVMHILCEMQQIAVTSVHDVPAPLVIFAIRLTYPSFVVHSAALPPLVPAAAVSAGVSRPGQGAVRPQHLHPRAERLRGTGESPPLVSQLGSRPKEEVFWLWSNFP
jgi:hypothetical protein